MDRYLPGVSTLELDVERCTGCAMCRPVCPQGVFGFAAKRAVIKDKDACMECSACSSNCEAGAISVRKGVGCAAGIMATALGRSGKECC